MIQEKFDIRQGISTIWYALKGLDLSWVFVRQHYSKTDREAQEEFKENPKYDRVRPYVKTTTGEK